MVLKRLSPAVLALANICAPIGALAQEASTLAGAFFSEPPLDIAISYQDRSKRPDCGVVRGQLFAAPRFLAKGGYAVPFRIDETVWGHPFQPGEHQMTMMYFTDSLGETVRLNRDVFSIVCRKRDGRIEIVVDRRGGFTRF